MSMIVQTGNVTASGTFTFQQVKHVVTIVSGTRNSTGTTTLGTVGAGKKWTILNVQLSCDAKNSDVSGAASVQLDGNKISYVGLCNYTNAASNVNSDQSWPYSDAPTLAATKTLTLVVETANFGAFATVTYVEEDAA